MLKKGIKEIRDHFTLYLKRVKMGEDIIVTERGRPIAIIRPIPEETGLEERLESASLEGLIRLPQKKENISLHKKLQLKGKPLTDIIIDEREKGW